MTPSPNDPIEITVNLRERILFRPERTSIPVPVEEWDALIERVKACKPSFPFWTATYSVAFAIGITAGLSIIPILFSQLPIWVLIAYAVICAFGIGIGIGLVIAARSDSHSQQSHIDDLIADMEKRRAPFSNPLPEHPEPEDILP